MVARLRGRPSPPRPPENEENQRPGQTSDKKSASQRFLITVASLSVICAVAASSALVYFTLGPGRTPVTLNAELPLETTGPLLDLGPFLVNLGNVDERRYLRLSLSLDFQTRDSRFVQGNAEARRLWANELKSSLTKLEPVFQDVVVTTLSAKQPSTLSQPNGKEELKAELIARFNRYMPAQAVVHNLYLTDFVIQ